MALTEEQFQQQVIDLAHLCGWKVAHFRSIRIQRKDGSVYYATPVQADGARFPDLIMGKEGRRNIAAEVKIQTGRVAKGKFDKKGRWVMGQDEWLELLGQGGADSYLWRPSDFDTIVEVLR